MLIAVTGANGFIGGRIVRHLAQKGHRLLAFGRRTVKEFELATLAEYIRWDITTGVIPMHRGIDAVVHCAAGVTDWAPYRDLQAVNLEGTRVVLETFQDAGQFIHISTASVYDPLNPKVFVCETEKYEGPFLNNYTHTKWLAEQVVASANRHVVILRPHAVYGPGDTTLIPRILNRRRFGRMPVIGDGNNLISLTHVDNLAHAVECALSQKLRFEVFNIADSIVATVNQVLAAVLGAHGLSTKAVHIPKALAWTLGGSLERAYQIAGINHAPPITRYIVSQMASEYTLSIDKAKTKLNYRPAHTYLTYFSDVGR